jgi:phospholipid/cholesterol/gamma-HCH transport system substrate-binding protein
MNSSSEWRTVRIGLLVAAALLVAAIGIVGITSRQKLFEHKAEYYSRVPDAAGLKEGGGVWFQGVEVGFISKIKFSLDVDAPSVLVYYKVSASLEPRIRAGTRATIKTQGLLGDKYLALSTPPHTLNERQVLPGEEIPIDRALNLEALGRGAQDLMGNTLELSKNINTLVGTINSGQGALPRLLNDPELGKITVEHLSSIGANLDKIASSLAGGQGFAGKLLTDRAYGEATAKDLREAIAHTNAVLKDIEEGRGGAGRFLKSGGEGEKIVANLSKASDALGRAAAAFDRPGSLANKLFMDDAYGDRLAANMLSISESLASILSKIDKGQGTLGALINDRSVYDSLSAVADGIQKSPIVGWYLKRKAEKAAGEEKRAVEQGAKP